MQIQLTTNNVFIKESYTEFELLLDQAKSDGIEFIKVNVQANTLHPKAAEGEYKEVNINPSYIVWYTF